jgi:hypothetical protein
LLDLHILIIKTDTMPKENTTQFTIEDVELAVSYYFQEGYKGDYFQPNEPDQVDILKITSWTSDIDITDLLSDYVINRLEDEIITHCINKS